VRGPACPAPGDNATRAAHIGLSLAGEQLAFHRYVVQRRRHRPDDANHAGTAQKCGERAAADTDHGRDLVPALAADVLEAKDFST
jgi:hypothetical protein